MIPISNEENFIVLLRTTQAATFCRVVKVHPFRFELRQAKRSKYKGLGYENSPSQAWKFTFTLRRLEVT